MEIEFCVDLDGTCIDLHRHICQSLEMTDEEIGNCKDSYSPWELKRMSKTTFWAGVEQKGPEWWADAPVYPWFEQLISMCERLGKVWILSSPEACDSAYVGKKLLLKKLFGSNFKNYTLTENKWREAKPHRFLIDDLPFNCTDFVKHGGKSNLFPQPYNGKRLIEWTDVYYSKYITQLESRVQEVMA